jgi:geranylgeranyl diphosphate synthase, type II
MRVSIAARPACVKFNLHLHLIVNRDSHRTLRAHRMQLARTRIEQTLLAALKRAERPGTAPGLVGAVRHALLPGGAWIRPQLCLAVAMACGDDSPALADAAATAIEMLHCASLVHDDLPCFDDASLRRGKASVHVAFGQPLAVLAGDALIVMAFETLGLAAQSDGRLAHRLPALLGVVARSVGMPHGIVAGQAWECEDWVALPDYHRAKTGSLFAAATQAGALAAGAEPRAWQELGECLGEAYQVADDIRDAACDAQTLGKPAGRDRSLGRPSAVAQWGMSGALAHFEGLLSRAAEAVPAGPGAKPLRALLHSEAERLLPDTVRKQVAA